MKKLLIFGIIIGLFLSASPCWCEVPELINYQGILTDDTGTPLEGTFNLSFKIYGSKLGNDSLWWEHQIGVPVSNGLFNVMLGSISPISNSVFSDTLRYLGIAVNFGNELTPRIRLASVPYAYRALWSDTAAYVQSGVASDTDWTISGDDMYSGVSGNVGIGTTTPEAPLEVVGTGIADHLRLTNTSTGGPAIYLNAANKDWVIWGTNPGADAGDKSLVFRDYSAAQNRLVIDSLGNVGIGTNSPSQMLDVADTVQMSGFKMPTGASDGYVLTSDAAGKGTWQAASVGIDGSGATNYLPKFTSSTTLGNSVFYESGGKIGLGTTTPDEKLHVVGNIKMVDGNQAAGYVLTSDANGVGTWQAASGGASRWTLTDSVLYTNDYWGIARGGAGNALHNDSAHTMVNLGVTCTTGLVGSPISYATVSGGQKNAATNSWCTVGGGESNKAAGGYATVSGGRINKALITLATVSGGQGNTASGRAATVGGGQNNTASGDSSVVAGGAHNIASGVGSTIAGGSKNTSSSNVTTVGGGRDNTASWTGATIAGGYNNQATDFYAAIGGGQTNTASEEFTTIGGGFHNEAMGTWSTLGGGYQNTSGNGNTDTATFIGGGSYNAAISRFGTVCGGHGNYNEGEFSVICGGYKDTLTSGADYSLNFGNGVYLDTSYRVAFFDGANSGRLGINRDDREGGINHPIHVGTNATNGNGAHLTAAGTWQLGSSRAIKENFEMLDSDILIKAISNLNVQAWNYKGSDERHIGPMAEDFVEAFDVGTIREDGTRENKYLASVDVAGVALAGVKELIQQNQELRQTVEELRQRIDELERKK